MTDRVGEMSEVPEVYRAHLRAVTGHDEGALRSLWAPDGVLEFPYAANVGATARLDGIEELVGYFCGGAMFSDFTFRDLRAWKIEGAPEYVLEVHGSATVLATGAAYEQDYIVRFGLSPEGRLAWMREFWDPTRLGS